ncbi:unnamed protein product [Didymodactylos carnosus]|uniref:TANC1/2-like winged helix domain-containing protein n=1 Tax=Didymodactylos carnosus TaxID=1234261 RepID=A0A813VDQ3_9BILA|nr:unnamed protein product [Didymodactylos carnosus]CAF0919357.1 unnamed protein product [Didymodactylos carnosus]CAF3627615.1 unnamed protein product [Didymodactylos carnosus]CAF3697015.1 unnamed protein product [Didymodactylos carnosus]
MQFQPTAIENNLITYVPQNSHESKLTTTTAINATPKTQRSILFSSPLVKRKQQQQQNNDETNHQKSTQNHLQKLFFHLNSTNKQQLSSSLNGNKNELSSNHLFNRSSLTQSQRSKIKTNGLVMKHAQPQQQIISKAEKKVINNCNSTSNLKTIMIDSTVLPPPSPEHAHKQLLHFLTSNSNNRSLTVSPSQSSSASSSQTSLQRMMVKKKHELKQQQINTNIFQSTASISPSMSNSDLSYSGIVNPVLGDNCVIHATCLNRHEHTNEKFQPHCQQQSQDLSTARYIVTPPSSCVDNHTERQQPLLNTDDFENRLSLCLHLQRSNVIDDDDEEEEHNMNCTKNSGHIVNRNWLYDEIVKQLKVTTKYGVCLISQSSGVGKTCVIENIIKNSVFGQQQQAEGDQVLNNDIQKMFHKPLVNSSFSFQWLQSRLLSYHFCDCSTSLTCTLPDIIHSIIYRSLEHPQLHSYRNIILNEQSIRKSITLNACIEGGVSFAFFNSFIEQLNGLKNCGHLNEIFSLSSNPQLLFIIIDGIDNELCDNEGQTITEFLYDNLHRLPTWLKLIITLNRNQKNKTEEDKFLKHFELIDLDDCSYQNLIKNDIQDYMIERFDRINKQLKQNSRNCYYSPTFYEGYGLNSLNDIEHFHYLIEKLSYLSQGNFLYLSYLCNLIERQQIPSFKLNLYDSQQNIPKTIDEILTYITRILFLDNEYDNHFLFRLKSILEICLASRKPLSLNELHICVNSDQIRSTINYNEFLGYINCLSLFLTRLPDSSYTIVHRCTRNWLIDDVFACDIKKGHSRLALTKSRTKENLWPSEAFDCIRHLSQSDLFSTLPNSIDSICLWISHIINEPTRLLVSLRNAYYPELNVSELLLLTTADPNGLVEHTQIPLLCIASTQGYTSFVELLVKYSADINIRSKQDLKTPLILACENGHEQITQILLQNEANVSYTDKFHYTAVAYAAKQNHIVLLQLLYDVNWPSIDNQDTMNRHCLNKCEAFQQAFVYASTNGCLQTIELLLNNMSDIIQINNCDSIYGETALTTASYCGHLDIVEYLLKQNANIDQTNGRQMTPLIAAVKAGMWHIVEYLIDQNASIEIADKQKRTPLIIAASEGYLAVIDSLIEKGANVNHEDEEHLTGLAWACLKGHYHACQTLIAHNSDINHKDINGRLPIDMAAFYGDPQLVQLLIDNGSIVDHVDNNGMRALDRAIGCRNVAVVNCLLKRSVKLGPSTWALASGKNDMMIILLNKLIEDGLTLYKKSQYKDAAYRFSYAMKKIPQSNFVIEQHQSHDVSILTNVKNNFQMMKYTCLINLAKCKRKMNASDMAIDYCTQALTLQTTSDALLLRARIKRDQRLYDDALDDLVEASKLEPDNNDLNRYMQRLKEEMMANKRQETLL